MTHCFSRQRPRSWGGARAAGLGLLLAAALCLLVAPGARADEFVVSCGNYANHVFGASSQSSISAQDTCPGGKLSLIGNGFNITRGQGAVWQAIAPAGLTITDAVVPSMDSYQVNAGSSGSYGGDFYWAGGSSNITPSEFSASLGPFSSNYFGFLLVCGKSSCPGSPMGEIDVYQITLILHETTGPTFSAPTGLWTATGWVRGIWPVFAAADSPSGVCALSVSLNGSEVAQSSSPQDPSQWHQCTAPWIYHSVVTSDYGQGAVLLTFSANDAAGVPASTSKTVSIDNQQPTVALSGPVDAPSTAGTQYVTATAAAGPSGVSGISCSLDGAPAHWYPSSSAQVPVSGVGQHLVRCSSENNAVDANGVHGSSPLESFSMKIGVPTVTAISFSTIVDKLHCRRVRERVLVPARWVTVHRHHRPVRIYRRAHTRLEAVTRCHARTKRERITVLVKVRRHGKARLVKRTKLVRVVVPPHVVAKTSLRVPYGHGATVNGWLGTTSLTALGGQTVQVLTAPDDGLGQFTLAGPAVTAADGSWSAQLPPGPSRLVIAAYQGGPVTEASSSSQVRVIVPAKARLISVTPRVPWGGTVHIVGQLEGGYLPAGGALVRLRIGQGPHALTYGVHEHVGGNGVFTTTYRFGAGVSSVHETFWFQIASLPTGDYPFAPSQSARRYVLVGGHPPPPPPRSHHHHRR